MARELLLALACACAVAAAAAARYGDYAAVKMPQYGDYDAPAAASDEYRDHSPDAPASLDYKYEEPSDKIEKTMTNDVEEEDAWNKPPKKIRKQKSVNDGDHVALNKYKLEEVVPKLKTNYQNKNRDRYRSKSKVITDDFPTNRRLNHDHSADEENQKLDFDDEDIEAHPEDFPEDTKSIEHEKSKFVRREIRKKSRRKPRDRPIIDTRMKPGTVNEEDESVLSDVRDIQKTLRGQESVYPDVEERPWVPLSPGLGVRAKPRVRARGEDDGDLPRAVLPPPKPPPPPPNINAYSDYADYYDMQRVQNIKNKLPPLLRRTKAREMEPTTTETYSSSWQPRKMFYRRKNTQPDTTIYFEDITSSSTRFTTTTSASTTTRATTTPSTTTVTFAPSIVAANMPLEMSLAEKSRLSILKKSQKKESFREESRTKPPVLLQVTERMHTVVMVEPAQMDDPWMRANSYDEDSPERLAKVKRLMKRKLIANAKSVRDLTDNWDDVICEYVDLSQLSAGSSCANVFVHYILKSGYPVLFVLYTPYLIFLI